LKITVMSLLSVCVLVLAVGTCLGQSGAEKVKAEVLQAENARLKAVVAGDTAALEKIFSDDLTYVHSSGVIDTKAKFIAKLKAGELKYESMQHQDPVVRIYGNTALINGRSAVRALSGGTMQQMTLLFTEVYVKQKGVWQMVCWQSLRLP
jgi:hypothetical protein